MKKQIVFLTLMLTGAVNCTEESVVALLQEPVATLQQPQTEMTFAIIKPDAVAANHTGGIVQTIENSKFTIARMEKIQLTQKEAENFYAEHKARPFFKPLVEYMTSGPVVVMALEKENAIADWRELMGATDPKNARVGTIRNMFGTDKSANAAHGSDSQTSATRELSLFFPDLILNLEAEPAEIENAYAETISEVATEDCVDCGPLSTRETSDILQ